MLFSKIPAEKRWMWSLYEDKKQIHYSSRDMINDYQTKKLQDLLKIANKTKYYRRILNGIGISLDKFQISDIYKLPVLTKDIIRVEKDNMLAKDKSLLFSNSSGGSTGQPLNFFQDNNYKAHTWATMMIQLEMSKWYQGARVARLWGAPQDKRALRSLKGKLALYLQNTRYYDTFDMSEEKIKEYHYDMQKSKPDIIVAYASSIYLMARYFKKANIFPQYPKLSIISSAEALADQMRQTIEEVFRAEVFDKYGSREVSAIACECEAHNGLHVFMDNVIIECIDPVTKKNVTEVPGEILITDLNNYGMPFIRYRIGDVGILSKDYCTCGRKTIFLKKVIGRTTDNFLLKSGKIIHGEYFTHLFYGIEEINEFQFVQETIDHFKLFIVANKDLSKKVVGTIRKEIMAVIGNDAQLEIFFVDKVPKTPTGKYKFTISKISIYDYWGKK
jgi:phenylacetate-CoA ligase